MSSISQSFIAVTIVSLISLIGIFTLGIKIAHLKKILIYVIAFSAGTMMGNVFFHLLPEVIEEYGFTLIISISIIWGVLLGFCIEKVIHRNHCHMPITENHKHPFARMNLVGDMFHNLLDGLIIWTAFIASPEIGIATTIAIILHEIPQEIGDFGVLIHGGFTKKRALLLNFLTALTAFIGLGIAIILNTYVNNISQYLIPLAAGLFIYIAAADLIPELHKEIKVKQSLLQIGTFIIGIGIMVLLMVH